MKVKLLSIIAVIIVLLSSCNKAEYVNVIPADASLVASVNLKEIAEKGDMQNSSVLGKLDSFMGLLVSGKDSKQMKEYLSNPQDMGIDFGAPAYVFKTAGNCMGLSFKVSSESDLKDFMMMMAKQNLCSKPQERDGYSGGSLLGDIEYSFNGKVLLIISSFGEGGTTMNKRLSAQLMSQDADNSFVSTEAFDKMESQKGDIKMYSNLGAAPESYANQFAELLPKGVKKSDIELLATISFEGGKAVFTSDIWGNTDKAQLALDESAKNLRKINGKFIDSPSQDFVAYVNMGVNGKWLLSQLKDNKDAKTLLIGLERGIDVEQIIRCVDGDFAIISNNNSSDVVALAEVNNSDFLADLDYWKQSAKDFGINIRNVKANDYLIDFGNGEQYNWGVDDNIFYITSSKNFNHFVTSPKSSELKDYESDIKHSVLFCYLNWDNMVLNSMNFALMSQTPVIGSFIKNTKCVIIKASSVNHVEVVVELKSKNENFLKQLL